MIDENKKMCKSYVKTTLEYFDFQRVKFKLSILVIAVLTRCEFLSKPLGV